MTLRSDVLAVDPTAVMQLDPETCHQAAIVIRKLRELVRGGSLADYADLLIARLPSDPPAGSIADDRARLVARLTRHHRTSRWDLDLKGTDPAETVTVLYRQLVDLIDDANHNPRGNR